ncbi:MAG: peptidase M16 [Gammaproteobacteria bacterium]|nr:MAG: peptidase M16 [Gammaproteobacteria bacterium]
MNKALFGLILLFAGFNLHAVTELDDVKSFTLNNGMKIMILEDHSIPNANMYIFWKVGSRNEYPGITGLSHFFEHMMFNGAKKYGPKQFDRVMEAAGGANNAYTSEDITAYTNWFPSSSMEVIFDLEADRIEHLAIDSKMVESERGVVTSERTTGLENSNFFMLLEQVKGSAFRAHPYSWGVMGHQSDIDNWSLDDLRNYHKTYYAPNNAVVVIAGDVAVKEVKRLAKKYFEPISAQPEPRKVHTVEPPQTGERRVYVQKESVTSANILMGFHVPETQHKDYYPLTMLASILGDGDSSRLYRSLVDEKQLATSVFTYMPDSFDPNLFYIYATAANGVNAMELEKAMIAELNVIMNEGVNQKELTKVKNLAQVNFYRTLSTINGKANTLGSYELFFGSYKKMFSAIDDMNKIDKKDIKRVANEYLIRSNRTVGILDSAKDSKEGDK